MNTSNIGVVGGGILGFLSVLRISKEIEGAMITIYEQGLEGSGASLRSAGVHFPYGRSAAVRAMI